MKIDISKGADLKDKDISYEVAEYSKHLTEIQT